VRWTKKPTDIERLARSQRIWLSAAANHVAPGGVLVYATCTLTRQENEDVVTDFLAKHPDFAPDAPPPEMDPEYLSPEGYVITNPPYDGLDGVFAARMKRQSGS
jgi:16S rRNA (cytosine967-C5)-methyltransferase